ncbi:XAC2610-related protein [Chryseobacterium sp. TY3]
MLVLGQFNFDGSEDVAVRNGNAGSYGGPIYSVYVYNLTKMRFVFSQELADLTFETLGMFDTDNDRKPIITYAKSGCC